jgi:hypothetical protein
MNETMKTAPETSVAADYLHDPVEPSLASALSIPKRALYNIALITTKDQIANPYTLQRLEDSHERSVELFQEYDDTMTIPSIEQYAAEGLNFTGLANAFEQMESENLKPEFVFYPIMPLIPIADYYNANNFRDFFDDTLFGLNIHEKVSEISQQIFLDEMESIVNNQNANYVVQDNLIWVASVVAGTQDPQHLHKTYLESLDLIQTEDRNAQHVGLSQFLTLCIMRGMFYNRSEVETWTEQGFIDNYGGARAVCVYPSLGDNQMCVDRRSVRDRGNIGARRSVRGTNLQDCVQLKCL